MDQYGYYVLNVALLLELLASAFAGGSPHEICGTLGFRGAFKLVFKHTDRGFWALRPV